MNGQVVPMSTSFEAPPMEPRQNTQQSNGFAVASLVLGIVSIVPILGWITSVLAVIFGALRLKRGSAGRGMAIAGFTLGVITLAGWLVWIAVLAASSTGS